MWGGKDPSYVRDPCSRGLPPNCSQQQLCEFPVLLFAALGSLVWGVGRGHIIGAPLLDGPTPACWIGSRSGQAPLWQGAPFPRGSQQRQCEFPVLPFAALGIQARGWKRNPLLWGWPDLAPSKIQAKKLGGWVSPNVGTHFSPTPLPEFLAQQGTPAAAAACNWAKGAPAVRPTRLAC